VSLGQQELGLTRTEAARFGRAIAERLVKQPHKSRVKYGKHKPREAMYRLAWEFILQEASMATRLTIREFATKHNIPHSTLGDHVKKLKKERVATEKDLQAFLLDKNRLRRPGRPGMKPTEEIEEKIMPTLLKMREAGAIISAAVAASVAFVIMDKLAPQELVEHGGNKVITSQWAKGWLSRHKWSKRRATTAKRHIPATFESDKEKYYNLVSNLVKEHNIPKDLIYNIDETGAHVVPVNSYTMAPKGSDTVVIEGTDDKRQVTAVVAVTATGRVLSPQVIYEGKTKQCEPAPHLHPAGWHITHSPNHWCNSDLFFEYITRVVVKDVDDVKAKQSLPPEQRALLILDVWTGHTAISDKLKELGFVIAWVPAGCTDELQPLDVSVNGHIKRVLRDEFACWYRGQIAPFLAEDKIPVVDMTLTRLKPIHLRWLETAINAITPAIILTDFDKSGLTAIFNKRLTSVETLIV